MSSSFRLAGGYESNIDLSDTPSVVRSEEGPSASVRRVPSPHLSRIRSKSPTVLSRKGGKSIDLLERQYLYLPRQWRTDGSWDFGLVIPECLLDKGLEQEVILKTLEKVNKLMSQAESTGCSAGGEGLLNCLLAFIPQVFCKTRYQKKVEQVRKFLYQENERIYRKAGLIWMDPTLTGFQQLIIRIL